MQSFAGIAGVAINALFVAVLFPALCLPLSLRSRFESGGWGLWTISLVLAILAALTYAAIIYVISAFAGTSGSEQEVRDAASYMFFNMGGPAFLAAIWWGPALSLLVRLTTGDHAKKGAARIGVLVAMLAVPVVLAIIGSIQFVEGLPKGNA
jgi:hypothetical protein